jgi:hypothetical protein
VHITLFQSETVTPNRHDRRGRRLGGKSGEEELVRGGGG